MLEDAGSAGVHSFEFYEARMPRGAAVIHALKAEGFRIDADREAYRGESHGVRYRLRGYPPEHPKASLPPAEPTSLFPGQTTTTVNPYDAERAA
jgi:hypothetical protein